MTTPRVLIIGDGRAGGSFAAALRGAGVPVEVWSHRRFVAEVDAVSPSSPDAASPREAEAVSPVLSLRSEADLVLLCVPDPAVAGVAAHIVEHESLVVAHCAGSLGLDVMAPASRRASLHPLVSLPDPERGAARLRGAWFAVAGDPLVLEVVEALDGRAVEVADEDRTLYHATAAIASNHLVALIGQVQRLADGLGVPFEAYLELMRGTFDNLRELSPQEALTGPVARGDFATVERHVAALPPEERAAYLALARAAATLAGRSDEPLQDL